MLGCLRGCCTRPRLCCSIPLRSLWGETEIRSPGSTGAVTYRMTAPILRRTTPTEHYRRQRLGHEKLTWKAPTQLAKLAPPVPLSRADAEDSSNTQTLSALGHGEQAGLPYGTLNRGPIFGDEVRPALPVATSDPVAYPWESPDSEGNVVVEITIDERGEIVAKSVLKSLGAKLDERVLRARELALPSRHAQRHTHCIQAGCDFHFKARA